MSITVTPFVGVWIETIYHFEENYINRSHPSWVCGLKHKTALNRVAPRGHTLRGCVD